MAYHKNYSFEYNAKSSDIFKSTVVCSYSDEMDDFKEGQPIDLEDASFYGVITESRNTGERATIAVTAESYARELRNSIISTEVVYRQTNAIDIIKDNLLPEGWTLEYPVSFDESPLYVSYILRNGTFLSHISTILQMLGLDFTIYTGKSGGAYSKVVKAYYRDNFDGRSITSVEQWKQFGAFSVFADYGKIATSVTVLGAESEQGSNQVVMDAEIGDFSLASHVFQIKDTKLSIPEFGLGKKYLWYLPISEATPIYPHYEAGDRITVDDETMVVSAIYCASGDAKYAYENGTIDETAFATMLLPVTDYVTGYVLVAEINFASTSYIESLKSNVTFTDTRNIGAYQVATPSDTGSTHGIHDDVFDLSCSITVSSYLTYQKNLPSTIGFIWLGSERVFYRYCTPDTDTYLLEYMTRGVPTCATASCEHCGTRDELKPLGWNNGCPFGGTDTKLSTYCSVASAIETAISGTIVSDCPLCFDVESVCPIIKCPFIDDDTKFTLVCPKHLLRSDVVWTQKYAHHKNSIVFPDMYYYDNGGIDVYEIYARDSLIHRYGYVSTQMQVKGVADLDGLDKVAEGVLRLSALPVIGQFTMFNYDPWTVPDGYFPGDVVQVKVASMGRYDPVAGSWYPTQWFDYASEDPGNSTDWVHIGTSDWYRIQQKFVIQKTVKDQRGMPQISFGTDSTDFQSIMEYLQDSKDTTSQRHKNQTQSVVVASTASGVAAKVKNQQTGKLEWVRVSK